MGYKSDMSDLLACEPAPSTVRSARLFVVDKLQEWGRDDLVDSAALLTSELVTNAVLHTGKPFTVRVAQRGSHVRVEVADSVHLLPSPARGGAAGEPLDLDHAFRGLNIVDSVASAWGSESIPGDGKIVWFELVGTRDGPGARRGAAAELSDLRDPGSRLEAVDGGNVFLDRPRQEVSGMARREHVVERDDDHIDEPRRGGAMRWVLAILVILAIVVIGFFALGGDIDFDSEGELEVPEMDVDVNPPDIDVDSEEAPPADADASADS